MYINITIETPMYRERANRSLLTNHWSTIHQLMIDHSLINYWLITDWPIIDLSLVEELHLSFFNLEKYSIKLDYISLIEITYFYIYIYCILCDIKHSEIAHPHRIVQTSIESILQRINEQTFGLRLCDNCCESKKNIIGILYNCISEIWSLAYIIPLYIPLKTTRIGKVDKRLKDSSMEYNFRSFLWTYLSLYIINFSKPICVFYRSTTLSICKN